MPVALTDITWSHWATVVPDAALLAGTPAIGRAMGREPDKWWILFNGAIECRLLVFEVRG